MLVHNSRKNETRVIDFRETAPSALQEDMLYTNLDLNVSRLFCHVKKKEVLCCLLLCLMCTPCSPSCVSAWPTSGSAGHAQWDASGTPALWKVRIL